MKRIVALIVSFVLLCVPALAEFSDVDLSSASLEEIIALRDLLNARILELTGTQETVLAQGVYKVGSDIAAGTYRVICEQNVESAFLYVYPESSANWYSFEHFYALGAFHACMDVGKLELAEGETLDIQGATLTFIPVEN